MRRLLVGLGTVLLSGVLVLVAASVHFVKGPTVTDAGTQLVISGKLAGLGEGDVNLDVVATGIADTECTNPGGNVAPGQDTVVEVFASVTLQADKNGHLIVRDLMTSVPEIPSSACPNSQWSAEAIDVAFGSGVITVSQGGIVVLEQGF